MDRQELGIRMEPDYFGPLWRYVRNDKITDIDYNGNQLWITDVENERYLIRRHYREVCRAVFPSDCQ